MADRFIKILHRETVLPAIVCDTGGTITRAIDRSRIGDIHAGAQRILRGEVDEAAVTAKEAAANPQVKEGCSCPITVDGQRVGTFGITGAPSITRPLARIAAMVLASWIREAAQREAHNSASQAVFSRFGKLSVKSDQNAEAIRNIIEGMCTAPLTPTRQSRPNRLN